MVILLLVEHFYKYICKWQYFYVCIWLIFLLSWLTPTTGTVLMLLLFLLLLLLLLLLYATCIRCLIQIQNAITQPYGVLQMRLATSMYVILNVPFIVWETLLFTNFVLFNFYLYVSISFWGLKCEQKG